MSNIWTYPVEMAERIEGAQVVGRVAALLRAVAAAPDGTSTTQVATATGLTRPTTHRLLTSLLGEGCLDRDRTSGRWYLGPEMYLMGMVAAHRYDVTAKARPIVEDLASRSGESAFFSARRGDETICLLRVDGSFPIRSFVLYEGARFPLGVASAGLVILSQLPPREAENYLQHADLAARWGSNYTRDALGERLDQTRRTGYALNPGLVVEGSFGIGAAVTSGAGRPEWALSLTGVESRFSSQRQAELGELLLKSAHGLKNILSGQSRPS